MEVRKNGDYVCHVKEDKSNQNQGRGKIYYYDSMMKNAGRKSIIFIFAKMRKKISSV